MNSKAQRTGQLQVGTNASVTGIGTAGGWIHATSLTFTTPTPLPTSSAHVTTFAAVGVAAPAYNGSAAAAAPYLNWASFGSAASGNQTLMTNMHAAGVHYMIYTDPPEAEFNPNKDGWYSAVAAATPSPATPLFAQSTAAPSSPAPSCTPAPIGESNALYFQYGSACYYLPDARTSALYPVYEHYINTFYSGAPAPDAVFEDTAGPLGPWHRAFYPGYPNGYTDLSWTQGEISMQKYVASAPTPIRYFFINGLTAGIGQTSPAPIASPGNAFYFFGRSPTIGGRVDDCYVSSGGTPVTGNNFKYQMTAELAMQSATTAANGKKPLFVCLPTDTVQSHVSARIYAMASLLLGYDTASTPSTSAMFESYNAGGSTLSVYPEEMIVVRYPEQSPTQFSDLPNCASAGYTSCDNWLLWREYSQCYVGGQFYGECAVLVNASLGSTPVTENVPTYFLSKYHSSLQIGNQSSVLAGGTTVLASPIPPSLTATTSTTQRALLLFH